METTMMGYMGFKWGFNMRMAAKACLGDFDPLSPIRPV